VGCHGVSIEGEIGDEAVAVGYVPGRTVDVDLEPFGLQRVLAVARRGGVDPAEAMGGVFAAMLGWGAVRGQPDAMGEGGSASRRGRLERGRIGLGWAYWAPCVANRTSARHGIVARPH